MKLEYLEIESYKNLKDFKIDFNQDSFLDLIIGKNGSGKSNFFEALIEIFGKLEKNDLTEFKYKIKYQLHGESIEIINWEEIKFLRNNESVKKSEIYKFIPSNVLYYYAGLDNRLKSFFVKTKSAYKKEGLKKDELSLRKFIDMDHFYYKLILIVMLIYNENEFKNFLKDFLNIETFDKIEITFKKPESLKKEKEFITKEGDFWGIKGVSKEIIDKLVPASVHDNEAIGGLSDDKEKFQIRLRDNDKVKNFRENIASPKYLFNSLELVFQYGMIQDISIVIPKNGETIQAHSLSEGEKQIITIVGLILLNESAETLILLDEPDAFLHPKWQFNLCRQVIEHSGESIKDSQLIINSHCASTLISSKDNQINLFEFDNNKITTSAISRKEAVSRLTEGFISLSEDESKLRIDNILRNSNKPIVFVEGPSDVIILEYAYKKLYETSEIPFLIQDAFNRGFLKILIKEGSIFTNYPSKKFFALFDFDDAYEDWRDISGEHIITDWHKGLCKKILDKEGYVLLLPVPNNDLKKQAIDENNPIEKIITNPHICVEHLFWHIESLKGYFKEIDKRDNKIISFKGDKYKIKFAQDEISKLNKDDFSILKPIFELINSKIQ